jgi:hypothetical protein
MPWIVWLRKTSRVIDMQYGEGFFPRRFYYKRDARELSTKKTYRVSCTPQGTILALLAEPATLSYWVRFISARKSMARRIARIGTGIFAKLLDKEGDTVTKKVLVWVAPLPFGNGFLQAVCEILQLTNFEGIDKCPINCSVARGEAYPADSGRSIGSGFWRTTALWGAPRLMMSL